MLNVQMPMGEACNVHMGIMSVERKQGVVSSMVKQKLYTLTKNYQIIFL